MIIVSFLNCVCFSLVASNPSHSSNQVPFIRQDGCLNCCTALKLLSCRIKLNSFCKALWQQNTTCQRCGTSSSLRPPFTVCGGLHVRLLWRLLGMTWAYTSISWNIKTSTQVFLLCCKSTEETFVVPHGGDDPALSFQWDSFSSRKTSFSS